MEISNEAYLAGLLWGLRILPGISPADIICRHEDLFSRYVDTDTLCTLLEGTGQDDAIIRHAYDLSGLELDAEGPEGGLLCSLRSVFSRLNVGVGSASPAYYQPKPLTTAGIFPDDAQKTLDGDILAKLERRLSELASCPPEDFFAFSAVLDTLLKQCLWAAPAAPGHGIDVSLYDRLRVTAAIACCMGAGQAGVEKPFLLLAADFSGIQNYIFAVARTNTRGVAKRLRARSFLVDAMIQALAYKICDRMDMPYGNILMLTGGKFYILLPNAKETVQRLEELCAAAVDELFRDFHGEVSVNMAWVVFGEEGLRDYSMTITGLTQRLREQKQRPFQTVLAAEDGWREERFILTDELAGKRTCPSCGRAFMDQTLEVCPRCREQEQLGGKLANAEELWFSRSGGEYRLWDDCWVSFSAEQAAGKLIKVEQINNWDLSPRLTCYPLGVRLMANHLPQQNGEPLTFGDIAEMSAGSERLAVLKADVDNLGYLFADGMREKQRHYGTVCRVSSMSRMLEMFFSGYIGHLLHDEPAYQAVYSVFSGGDDLFLIGPWDVMPGLALRIEQDFRRYTGNPCVTLSAAVYVADPKTNIALLAEQSEAELKRVKNSSPRAVYPGKSGRDAISFLGDIFSWDDFAQQMQNVERLRPAVGTVSTAILRRIMTYSQMYRRFLLDHDVMGLMFEPLMHYDQMRNYPQKGVEEFLHYARELPKNAANYHKINKNLYFAQTVMRCLLNWTKEERKDGIR